MVLKGGPGTSGEDLGTCCDGVRVNAVSPGMVRTRMTNFSGAPVETVIDLFIFLASDASRRITGRSLEVGTWRSAVGLRG